MQGTYRGHPVKGRFCRYYIITLVSVSVFSACRHIPIFISLFSTVNVLGMSKIESRAWCRCLSQVEECYMWVLWNNSTQIPCLCAFLLSGASTAKEIVYKLHEMTSSRREVTSHYGGCTTKCHREIFFKYYSRETGRAMAHLSCLCTDNPDLLGFRLHPSVYHARA